MASKGTHTEGKLKGMFKVCSHLSLAPEDQNWLERFQLIEADSKMEGLLSDDYPVGTDQSYPMHPGMEIVNLESFPPPTYLEALRISIY